MFGLCQLGLPQLVAMRVDALRQQLSGLDGFLPGLRQRKVGVRAERHVDSVFGARMPVVEIPRHRAIYPDLQ